MIFVNGKKQHSINRYRLLLLALLAGLSFATLAQSNSSAPNILFILTDDQGAVDVGAYGNRIVHTPNIDKLAKQGTMFTQVFNQGSWRAAVCAPSRAMINTGRNLFHAKAKYPLWGETFRQAGYETFLTGKWHVSKKALYRSFDLGKAIFTGGMTHDHYNATMVDLAPNSKKLSKPYPSGKHTSELIADAAVDYLQDAKRSPNKPFLMYVGLLAPHDARQSPPAYLAKYPAEKIPLPSSFREQHVVDQGDFWVRDEILLPQPRKKTAVKQFIADYYAMIEHADAQIGRILDALAASPYVDNTIVIFTSDHGLAVGRHGLLGKQNQYDHSVQVPFIVAGKGISAGVKRQGNFYLNSLFPSTAELAGIKVPESVQAKSFVPVLTGKKAKVHKQIYGAYRHYQRMIRTDDYKLIYYPLNGMSQLFDLKADPDEINNLASSAKHAEVLASMRALLAKEMQRLSDPLDFNEPVKSFNKKGYSTQSWSQMQASKGKNNKKHSH